MISMKHLQSLWITLEYCMFFYTYAKHVGDSERSCYLLCFIYTFVLLAALLTACATVSTGKLKSLHCSLTLNDNLYVTVMVSIWQCWLNQRQRACSETDAEQLRRLSTSTTDDNNEYQRVNNDKWQIICRSVMVPPMKSPTTNQQNWLLYNTNSVH